MSIQALNWAMQQDQIKNSGTRFVLLILCNYANEAGQCYPSRETLAKKTSMTARSVQSHLNWLSENGYISWEHQRTGSQQSSNLYQIQSENFSLSPKTATNSQSENFSPSKAVQSENISLSNGSQGENFASQGENFDTFQGENISPNTKVLKPSEEPKDIRAAPEDPIEVIFDAWRRILDHPAAKLDKKRRARLKARLDEGFTVTQMLLVPQGVLRSPWHLGDNPNGIRYDKIETIYRDREQVEHFIDLANARPLERIGRQSTPHLAVVPDIAIPMSVAERRPPDDSPAEHRELWRAFRDQIKQTMSRQAFETWFGPVIFDGLNADRNKFKIRCDVQIKDWIEKYYAEAVYNTFVAIGCAEFSFEWELENQLIYEEAA